jgi:tRNA 2-thiouridine synthesizing protein A
VDHRVQAIEVRPPWVKRTRARIGTMQQQPEELDLSGLKCPLPALMTARALRRLAPGMLLVVTVTDPLAPLDIKFLCAQDGHDFLEQTTVEAGSRLLLRRCQLENSERD